MTDIVVNRRMDRREWLALVVLSIFWGGSFLFAGIQVKWLPPFTIAFLRVGLAAVILNVLINALGKTMPADRRRLARLPGDGHSEQRDSVLPHRLGPELHRLGAGGDPQRHHADHDRDRRAFCDQRRKDHRQPPARRSSPASRASSC